MRSLDFPPAASGTEVKNGWIYFLVQTLVLKSALNLLGAVTALNATELNFIGFLANFIAFSWIFRVFLLNSLVYFSKHLIAVLFFAAVGVCGYEFWTAAVSSLILYFDPAFLNANNATLISLAGNGRFLMIVSTVILAPLAEECVFREMIYRQLAPKNILLAYAVSAVTFALGHVVGYVGFLTPMQFALSVAQYLPAGVFLCWTYHRSGTILSPLLMHMLINAGSIPQFF